MPMSRQNTPTAADSLSRSNIMHERIVANANIDNAVMMVDLRIEKNVNMGKFSMSILGIYKDLDSFQKKKFIGHYEFLGYRFKTDGLPEFYGSGNPDYWLCWADGGE